MSEEDLVLVWREGSLGRIRLNRPKALNSLTLAMIRALAETLEAYEGDPDIAMVAIDGAGERGFCAGGDIRAIHDSGKAGGEAAKIFFREEYALNARIAAYQKPYVALMDGITMGGGVGLSAHGGHRLVTERTRLAMPETGIGFFPDVGATWLLARAPGEVGTYLGLTGAAVAGADAIFAGLADMIVNVADWTAILRVLAELPPGSNVAAALAPFARPADAALAAHRALIDAAFARDTVPEILAALAEDGSDFARETAATIGARSPTSLVLTLRLLRLARASGSLQECLDRELIGAAGILSNPDFYEGVRAAVIDKDRKPRWSPATLDEVTPESLRNFLAAD